MCSFRLVKYFIVLICLTTVSAIADSHGEIIDESTTLQELLNDRGFPGVTPTTLGIMVGDINSNNARLASDLALVLNEPTQFRLVPMIGQGALQTFWDLLYLRGVDLAIVQSNLLAELKSSESAILNRADEKIRYIAQMYQENVHVIAKKSITSLTDLAGKRISVGSKLSANDITSKQIFRALNLQLTTTHMSIEESMLALRRGEISAVFVVANATNRLFVPLRPNDELHFLPINYSKELEDMGFKESRIYSGDYLNLDLQSDVNTVSVSSVLATYNWDEESSRYLALLRFCKELVEHQDELILFNKNSYHPLWREVDLFADVPSWTRFEPMKKLLNR